MNYVAFGVVVAGGAYNTCEKLRHISALAPGLGPPLTP